MVDAWIFVSIKIMSVDSNELLRETFAVYEKKKGNVVFFWLVLVFRSRFPLLHQVL